MSALFSFHQIKRTLGNWWRKHIVAECPEARDERIRLEQIAELNVYADFRKAIWLWEFDRQNGQETLREAA